MTNRASGVQTVRVQYGDLPSLESFAWWQSHQGRLLVTDRLVGFCLLSRRELVMSGQWRSEYFLAEPVMYRYRFDPSRTFAQEDYSDSELELVKIVAHARKNPPGELVEKVGLLSLHVEGRRAGVIHSAGRR